MPAAAPTSATPALHTLTAATAATAPPAATATSSEVDWGQVRAFRQQAAELLTEQLRDRVGLDEPSRREILDLLRGGERPVNELVDELGLSQPAVSKHLRVLRDAGLDVDIRRDELRKEQGLPVPGLVVRARRLQADRT